MVASVSTVAYLGLEARAVEVQVQLIPGLPAFHVVGLGDKAVGESRERVRGAIAAMGLALPPKRIVVNLSPADLPKEGSHFDLPIALALLAAMGVVDAEALGDYVVVGELGLDARIAPSPGVLLAALHASEVGKGLVCPAAQGSEAAWAGPGVLAAPDILSLINHFKGHGLLGAPLPGEADETIRGPDLRQVKGQETAKRALEIAAAGGHNLVMVGPPGAGKSLMASCLPGILPPLDAAEALEVSMVASVAGTLTGGRMTRTRPYRAPHHSASMAALVGGGLKVKPGEVSLAHLGVLFLDELPEFQRAVLDSLRQPLETSTVSVARANAHVTFPARVQLIAAMNPCRCGHLGDAALACSRAPKCAADYQAKVSARCSTASTCISRCKRSAPPISSSRRPPKARPKSPRASPPRAPCRRRATPTTPAYAPMPRPTALCSTPSRRPTNPAASCSRKRRRRCACRRAATPASCVSRVPSPIWRARRMLGASMSRRR